jgi:hypothetical protein
MDRKAAAPWPLHTIHAPGARPMDPAPHAPANAVAPHIGTQGLHRVFGFRRQRMNPVTEDLHSNNQTKRLGALALVELPLINMEYAYLVKDLYGNLSNINASLLLFGTH